jgi:hypothetical protein
MAAQDLGTYLQQYGLFGLIFLDAFVTRKVLMPIWAHKDAVAAKEETIHDRDKTITEKNADIRELKTSLDKLQALTRDQMLPALVRANQLSADYLAAITKEGVREEQSRTAAKRPSPKRKA